MVSDAAPLLPPGVSIHFYRAEGSAFPLLADFQRMLLTRALALSAMRQRQVKHFVGFFGTRRDSNPGPHRLGIGIYLPLFSTWKSDDRRESNPRDLCLPTLGALSS